MKYNYHKLSLIVSDKQKAIAFFLGVELSALNHLLLDGLLIHLPARVKARLKGN
jgi:uncharacterized metal-binding protein